jgi:hypothetical protein
MKTETYPLTLSSDLLQEAQQTAQYVGISLTDTLQRSLKLGLPRLREQLVESRVTNVDPLPDDVLDRIYSRRDDDEEGTKKFIAAQSFHSHE